MFVTLFGRGVCGCLAKGLPLFREVVIVFASVEVVLVDRGVRYSLVVQILLGGGSLGGSPRWTS